MSRVISSTDFLFSSGILSKTLMTFSESVPSIIANTQMGTYIVREKYPIFCM